MKNKGKFIVVEGADGTGKKTQTDMLNEALKREGYPVEMFDFPQYETTFFGALVGRFLKGEFGSLNDVNSYLASLTFAGDRWQAKEKISALKDEGKIVIANRYFLSNVAHQSAKLHRDKRDEFERFLQTLEYGIYGIPKEDLNIILTVPPEISQRLIEEKSTRAYLGGIKKDIQEDNLDYQREVSAVYLELAKRYPGVVEIDCSGVNGGELKTREEIHNLILNEVRRVLEMPEGRIVREGSAFRNERRY
ncbi:MAG TPA: thymidylate kinase [Patescibacteria group bacterium]|nr:thymidylate kinase [Patescibacteria group bacterium]